MLETQPEITTLKQSQQHVHAHAHAHVCMHMCGGAGIWLARVCRGGRYVEIVLYVSMRMRGDGLVSRHDNTHPRHPRDTPQHTRHTLISALSLSLSIYLYISPTACNRSHKRERRCMRACSARSEALSVERNKPNTPHRSRVHADTCAL